MNDSPKCNWQAEQMQQAVANDMRVTLLHSMRAAEAVALDEHDPQKTSDIADEKARGGTGDVTEHLELHWFICACIGKVTG